MRRIRWLIIVMECAVVIHSTSGAYLPELGPAPLRFRGPAGLLASVSIFPPLRMDDAVNATNAVALQSTSTQVAAAASEPLGPELPPQFIGPENEMAWTNPGTLTAGPVSALVMERTAIVTPQMLADYLKQMPTGTNQASAMLPAGIFIPPQPPSSSAAVYKSN